MEPYDPVRGFARQLAGIVASQAPQERTLEQLKAQRGTRVFIDTNRNGYANSWPPPMRYGHGKVRPFRCLSSGPS